MSNNLPKVCVVICNHNYGDFVVGAIESALRQDYGGTLEVVVVDDASTDKSVENISAAYELWVRCFDRLDKTIQYYDCDPKDPKLKGRKLTLITSDENIKQGEARNLAIREAWSRADYFAILDSDDEMMPDKIRKCVAKATEYPDMVGSVHTDYYIENTVTGVTTYEHKPPFSKELLLAGDCHLHSGGVISKLALERVGLFDKDVPPKEDYLMWLKIAHYFMCVHIPEPLVRVRVTPNNSTASHTDAEHRRQYQLMWTRYQEWLSKQGVSNA